MGKSISVNEALHGGSVRGHRWLSAAGTEAGRIRAGQGSAPMLTMRTLLMGKGENVFYSQWSEDDALKWRETACSDAAAGGPLAVITRLEDSADQRLHSSRRGSSNRASPLEGDPVECTFPILSRRSRGRWTPGPFSPVAPLSMDQGHTRQRPIK